MERTKFIYEAPQVEVMEIEAEQCFATSQSDGRGGTEYLDPSNGSWF